MRIAVDGMGLDLGLEQMVIACNNFANKFPNDKLFLVALEDEIKKYQLAKNIEIVYATEVISMEEGALAIRRKKDASMVKAVELVANKQADAVLSAGSTGAFLTTAAMQLRFIPGIQRAALVGAVPNVEKKFTTILDLGANAENNVAHLVQFAMMGHLYAKYVLNIEKPRIALLNNGSESKKGDELRKKTHESLTKIEKLNFIGNIEAKDLLNNVSDVIVTDGFTGNIVLKTLEGTVKTVLTLLKQSFLASLKSKIAALMVRNNLQELKSSMDSRETGGALLLGVNGVVVKAHGNSDAYALERALLQTKRMVEANIVQLIANDEELAILASMKEGE